jgi:hypothetical protein
MSEESKTAQNRREFVKTAAKVAVTAPAAAMLLNASVKPANAAPGQIYGDNAFVTADDNYQDDRFVNSGDDGFF